MNITSCFCGLINDFKTPSSDGALSLESKNWPLIFANADTMLIFNDLRANPMVNAEFC